MAEHCTNGKQATKKQTAIIIGGGISGLSCAFELTKLCPGLQITILEKGEQAGGVIKTLRHDDLLIECGPESFSTLKPDVVALSERLEIKNRIISTSEENRRSFVCLDSRLQALPEGFMMIAPANLWTFAFSNIMSLQGKMRMALDLLIPRPKDMEDESLSDFVNRRLGNEALQKLAEPMIGGIYGGDPQLLSAASTIPQLVDLERNHGSIIKGLMNARRKEAVKSKSAGPRYAALASFDGGITVLVQSIMKNLPVDCLLTSKEAVHIVQGRGESRWTVLCADNSSYNADYVVLSASAKKSSALLGEVNPAAADKLQRIPRSSAILINLVYDRKQVHHPLNGFGFVVPRSENMLISACSFSSIKFAGRSSGKTTLFRIFTGGTFKDYVRGMSDEELSKRCHQELKTLLNITAEPAMNLVTRIDEAIPQYLVGHSRLVEDICSNLHNTAGLAVIGNSYIGVGLPDCVKTARLAATRISEEIKNSKSTAASSFS